MKNVIFSGLTYFSHFLIWKMVVNLHIKKSRVSRIFQKVRIGMIGNRGIGKTLIIEILLWLFTITDNSDYPEV
jgi:hypothetical protein